MLAVGSKYLGSGLFKRNGWGHNRHCSPLAGEAIRKISARHRERPEGVRRSRIMKAKSVLSLWIASLYPCRA